MPSPTSIQSKPRSEVTRSELIGLPTLTSWRRLVRILICWFSRLLVFLWTRPVVSGLGNIPKQEAALLISNHLGDADLVLGLAFSPVIVEIVTKIELVEIPILGSLLQAYGVIWVRRGQPDRKALRAILQGLKEGRKVGLAPEGRESLTGALEEGSGGAAYLALKADVPLIPVTFTGTENQRVLDNIKRFRRTNVSMTIGPPFRLENLPDWREAVTQGTKTIMHTLASQLPPAYRGVYEIEVREQSERV